MTGPSKETLTRIIREFGCHPWDEAELQELVTPRQGIISGFADVLADHRKIRSLDLPGLEGHRSAQESDRT